MIQTQRREKWFWFWSFKYISLFATFTTQNMHICFYAHVWIEFYWFFFLLYLDTFPPPTFTRASHPFTSQTSFSFFSVFFFFFVFFFPINRSVVIRPWKLIWQYAEFDKYITRCLLALLLYTTASCLHTVKLILIRYSSTLHTNWPWAYWAL